MRDTARTQDSESCCRFCERISKHRDATGSEADSKLYFHQRKRSKFALELRRRAPAARRVCIQVSFQPIHGKLVCSNCQLPRTTFHGGWHSCSWYLNNPVPYGLHRCCSVFVKCSAVYVQHAHCYQRRSTHWRILINGLIYVNAFDHHFEKKSAAYVLNISDLMTVTWQLFLDTREWRTASLSCSVDVAECVAVPSSSNCIHGETVNHALSVL